ncbi:MAG: hypothetical protein SFY81_14755 [Verrucomicrobiota bacterium]|nr:hypothetical protein [Verrucomicrobiota bacterium]
MLKFAKQKWLLWLLIIGGIATPFLYQQIKKWRSHALVAKAEKAIRQQRWNEAFRTTQAAYQLNPNDEKILRAAARLYSVAENEHALTFWNNLIEIEKASEEDRRELVRIALRLGKADMAYTNINQLIAINPTNALNLQLATEVTLVSRNFEQATAFAEKWVELSPANRDAKLLLGQALHSLNDPAANERALEILKEVATGTDQASLDALLLLSEFPVGNHGLAMVAQALRSHPKGSLHQLTRAAELEMKLHPERREELFNELSQVSLSDPENRLNLARWYNRHRAFNHTLEVLPATFATNQTILLAHLDALAGMREWSAVSAILKTNRMIQPYLRELYLARVNKELGSSQIAESHWRKVMIEATGKPDALAYVAEYAEQLGEWEQARWAYQRLTTEPKFSERAYAGLIRLAEQQGSTRTLRELMKEIVSRSPQNEPARNDLAYLNLLLNEQVEASEAIAAALYREHPNRLAYRTTLALALLRQGRAGQARELYAGVEVNWLNVLPGWLAVRAAVLNASGEKDLARTLVRPLRNSRLKPEEQELIKPLL